MHSSSILTALLCAFAATSYASPDPSFHTLEVRKDKNSTEHGMGKGMGKGNSLKAECATMRKLTTLTTLAANQTKLDELMAKGAMSSKKVDEIKSKAAAATTKLQTLTSNSTLTTACQSVDAEAMMKSDCKQMKRLNKLAMLAGNTTALDAFAAKKKMNETQVDGLKAKLQKAETKLKSLQSNATLTAFCKQMKSTSGNGVAAADGTSSSGAAASSGSPKPVATSGAQGLLVTGAYVAMPVVAGVFAFFL
jgi:hypothetical protein